MIDTNTMNANTPLFVDAKLGWVKDQELISNLLIAHSKRLNSNSSFDIT